MNTNHSSYQQQKFSVTNIGSVTLMMIFIVLCMVTFAALSLSSASYDWRSAKKSADHTTAYYQTSNQAETIDVYKRQPQDSPYTFDTLSALTTTGAGVMVTVPVFTTSL